MAKRYVELETFISTVKATPRCDLATALMIANNYSTADVVEVKHGYWKDNGRCSCCEAFSVSHGADYCPHCGAKMDGKPQEEV